MNCSKCQTELVEGARYCHNCGLVVLNKFAFMQKSVQDTTNAIAEKNLELEKELQLSKKMNTILKEEFEKISNDKKQVLTTLQNFANEMTKLGFSFTPVFTSTSETGSSGFSFSNTPDATLVISGNGNIGISTNVPSQLINLQRNDNGEQTEDSETDEKTN